ncbi:25536_t:CDS:2 [Gigaspora rosea]|nr:25536_t:CDS:2 [Gigaspora rosea]
MANTVNQFLEKFIDENESINKHDYKLSFTDDNNISHEKWIEYKINEGLITEYKFDDFIEFNLIGTGAFSIVYKVKLKNTEDTYALKIIHNNEHTNKEIVNEIKHIISVGFHENITKFYGISKLKAIKLADFGLSRRIAECTESKTTSEIFGVIPYIDPQCFLLNNNQNGESKKYKKTKKSDVYSVGVILWEISSEKTPFKDDKDNVTLPFRISNGLREEPISDTNHKYVAIYKKCWQGMQDDRPSIQEVARELKDIIIQGTIIQDISDNELFDIFNIDSFTNYLNAAFNQNVSNNSVEQEDQQIASGPKDDDMARFVNELYSTFSKLFNEGRSVSNIIINSISKDGKKNEEVFKWLSEHDDNPKNICLLGLFYSWEIGTKKDNVNVLNLFLNAANSNDIIAQYFVGKCYEIGWNTRRNMRKAIEWYTKASQSGCAIAECMLGEYCYKLHRYEQAFKLLKSAADKGNALAMNTLATCCQRGYGTKVDRVEGFKLFEKAAKIGLPASQYELGDCYEYGNGIKINLKKALIWYEKASENNPNYLNHVKRVENKIEQLRKSSTTLS